MSENITRPIIGIENRTAQEVFDIMVARIGATPLPVENVVGSYTHDLRSALAPFAQASDAFATNGPLDKVELECVVANLRIAKAVYQAEPRSSGEPVGYTNRRSIPLQVKERDAEFDIPVNLDSPSSPQALILSPAITDEMVNAAWNEGKRMGMTGLPSDFRSVLRAALSSPMGGGE